jgi:hypothetical protein
VLKSFYVSYEGVAYQVQDRRHSDRVDCRGSATLSWQLPPERSSIMFSDHPGGGAAKTPPVNDDGIAGPSHVAAPEQPVEGGAQHLVAPDD